MKSKEMGREREGAMEREGKEEEEETYLINLEIRVQLAEERIGRRGEEEERRGGTGREERGKGR